MHPVCALSIIFPVPSTVIWYSLLIVYSYTSSQAVVYLYEINVSELVSFIVVRNKVYTYAGKLPNKCKIDETLNGVPTLVSVTFDSQGMSNYVKAEYEREAIIPPHVVQNPVDTITLDSGTDKQKVVEEGNI